MPDPASLGTGLDEFPAEAASSPYLSIHGFAWWNSFQFVNPQDEAQFRAADYAAMEPAYHLVTSVQFGLLIGGPVLYDYSSTPLGRTKAWLVPQLVAILVRAS